MLFLVRPVILVLEDLKVLLIWQCVSSQKYIFWREVEEQVKQLIAHDPISHRGKI